MWTANIAAAAFPKIDMDVIMMGSVGTRRQHCREESTCRALDIAQEALLFRQTVPTVLYDYLASVGERESRDVKGIAEGMLGYLA